MSVLIIEDDDGVRESLAAILREEGYVVEVVGNGTDALQRLRERTHPTLILLDLMMPVMSGGEFLAVLRQTDATAAIPVVIVSAWAKEVAKVRAQSQGVVDKPISIDALLEATHKFCVPEGGP